VARTDGDVIRAAAAGHRHRYRHPVNRELVDHEPRSQRIADAVTNFLGSWTFIIIQTLVVAAWVAGNVYLVFHFDPYPFIFLNLAFSTQAAYAAPLILLASNRAAVRDRMTLEHAAMQTDVEEGQNERLLTGLTDVLTHVESVEQRILELQQRILQLEQGILTRIQTPGIAAPATQGTATPDPVDAGDASDASRGTGIA
jgi:uncharacterized membrane protein